MEQASLSERVYEPLPLGSIKPRGWLRKQLEIQAESVTGQLDEVWEPLADNKWLGGTKDGWERGPYYADGLVPLAYLLDDESLQAKADKWIEGFIAWQNDDGWIGPRDPEYGNAHDVWPRAILLKVFRQYYEATGDDRVREAALQFCDLLYTSELDEHPLENWGKFRWQDLALGIHWLYKETNEDWLLSLATTVAEQGYDWQAHFSGDRRKYGFAHSEPAPDWNYETHVVNNAMGVKAPAVKYRQTGEDTARGAAINALDTLDTYHGQATGLFTGDENLAGRDPTRGTELCAVVEYMFTLEELIATLGLSRLADRLERITFNALPATFASDMWAHQYDQQANQVLCAVGEFPWTNSPDANCFGLAPNYGCCTANLHQGWPKFASHCWMRGTDGLAAVVYAPSEVTMTAEGTTVTILEETDYPFEDQISFTIETDSVTSFSLEFRIPEWAEDAVLHLPDGSMQRPDAGQFYSVNREWDDGEEILLEFNPSVTVDRRYQGGVALHRGPLVFSLPIMSEAQKFPGEDEVPYAHREYYPTEPWNYGLAIDTINPEYTLTRSDLDDHPFSNDPPIELTVEGARIDNWTMDGNRAGDLPRSPVEGGDREQLTLVPYGCTTLRVTEFPLLD